MSGTFRADKSDDFASILTLFLPVRVERSLVLIMLRPDTAAAPRRLLRPIQLFIC